MVETQESKKRERLAKPEKPVDPRREVSFKRTMTVTCRCQAIYEERTREIIEVGMKQAFDYFNLPAGSSMEIEYGSE